MTALFPMKIQDFLKIAEDNNRTVWYYETDNLFELYVISDNVISYTEMHKEGLNMEQTFSSKVFMGSKILPFSLRLVNNYNNAYLDSEKKRSVPKESSVPVHEEVNKTEIQYQEEIKPEIVAEHNSKFLPIMEK